ncbi:BLTX257 [Caerostris extrusa]|uniref:BLTX257 n=1 Tax=Caerostris extrusa TaxID=172846 RepID=A0AAV4N6Y4_CAEEX|nr:BLTX257 [Caerostris extrusa]
MIWSLETDDFRGKCGQGKYPLLTTIYTKLNGAVSRPTVNPDVQTTKSPDVVVPTSPPGQGFKCTKDGYFRDPDNCSVFYVCVKQGEWDFAKHKYSCGEDAAFDESTSTCTFKHLIPGC